MVRQWDSANDKSTCRKYRIESTGIEDALQCIYCKYTTVWKDHGTGYRFDIYDWVIDVPPENPGDTPTVEDNRFIASVFVCDECYKKKTVPNE